MVLQEDREGRKGNASLMRSRYAQADALSKEVIGAAIEVHRLKGPGLVESIYEKCLNHELGLRGISVVSQKLVEIEYKGCVFEEPLRVDLLAEDCLVIELKAVEKLLPVHEAQLLSYMKLLECPVGLLFNFHELTLKNGIRRLTLKGAYDEEVCPF